MYIKPFVAQLTGANPVNLTKFYSINVKGTNGIVPKQSSAITQNYTASIMAATVPTAITKVT